MMEAERLPPARVASLLAAGTELVCALGAGDRLVARSHECDTPDWVKTLPAVSRPTFPITGSSAEIDALVRERMGSGEPLYEIDHALLARLSPDLVVTQTHCRVCAVAPGDILRGAACSYPTVAMAGGTIEEVLFGFTEVAGALGLPSAGASLVSDLRLRLGGIREKVRLLPRVKVACLEWMEPVFLMGNWGPELVDEAGGDCLLARPGEPSKAIAWEEVRALDPEVLVVAPCGFGMRRTLEEIHALERKRGWDELSAVRQGRVFVADGNLYFNRSSPSLFETVQILAEILHPREFRPSYEGRAWRRLGPELSARTPL